MDETTHTTHQLARQQISAITDVSGKLDILISLMKETANLQRDLLTFFVALDKREMGMEDTNSQEYLTELRKDGFEPRTE